MKKSLLSKIFAIFMALSAPASAEPTRLVLVPCIRLQKLAKIAAIEALARSDHNIFQTKVYTVLTAEDDKDIYKRFYYKFFALAQSVIDEDGTSEQASEAALTACLKS